MLKHAKYKLNVIFFLKREKSLILCKKFYTFVFSWSVSYDGTSISLREYQMGQWFPPGILRNVPQSGNQDPFVEEGS